MKTIKKDLKNGKMVLRLEVQDDLWYLADIIGTGDVVISKTKRRMEKDVGTKRAERSDKETVTLGIEVETVEFDKNVDRLRITGKIVSGPVDIPRASYHTLNIAPGSTITVQKESWNSSELVKVKEAGNIIKAKILLIAIEEGICSFGLLRNYGVQELGTIHRSISGKREIKSKQEEIKGFFSVVLDSLAKETDIERIIIAGPGFVKDNFYNFLKERDKELANKAVVESVSMAGRKGLEEIVKRGIIEKVVKEAKISSEVRELNKLLEEISKSDGLATYGLKEVENAANMGAIETLLVTNDLLKKYKLDKNPEVENIIKVVEQTQGNIVLVSTEHELGMQLEGLGGIAGILRYKI